MVVAAEVQPLPTRFAHDAAPQHIVQIDDDETPRRAVEPGERGADVPGGLLEQRRCEP